MSSAIEEKTINGQTLSVFVLIDALGWKYLEGREFLADLLPYRHPLRTISNDADRIASFTARPLEPLLL